MLLTGVVTEVHNKFITLQLQMSNVYIPLTYLLTLKMKLMLAGLVIVKSFAL